ncbi:MAG TPA: hypothetical protein VK809_07345 [Bacteroidia bacterium]|jgi:hypothetical protein|nr:hypothetical protein [Bacteroidia bacterium]
MKNKLIAFVILAVTFLLPFRYAVLDVDSDAHGLSVFGVFFTGVGFLAGFYFLIKDDADKEHGGEHSAH